jgi:hypothetical protein
MLTVMTVIAILASISMLILGLNPKRAANEAAAIAAVRSLVTAEKVYWTTAGRFAYGDLGELGAEGLIDSVLASGTRQGYTFSVSKGQNSFTVTASPVSAQTGTRSFFADDTGVIRCRPGPGAGATDPPIGN